MDFDPTPWTNWLALFLALAAVITLFARWIAKGARKREIAAAKAREEMVALIRDVASQVQPRNGGTGWTDLHKKVDVLVNWQSQVVTDVALLKAAVLQLEDDVDGMR